MASLLVHGCAMQLLLNPEEYLSTLPFCQIHQHWDALYSSDRRLDWNAGIFTDTCLLASHILQLIPQVTVAPAVSLSTKLSRGLLLKLSVGYKGWSPWKTKPTNCIPQQWSLSKVSSGLRSPSTDTKPGTAACVWHHSVLTELSLHSST